MKEVCVMQGAIKNAGDYLIDQRGRILIDHFMNCSVESLTQVGIDYSDRIDYFNSKDAIFFVGGPIYMHGIWPKEIPFVNQLKKIKTPVFFIGGGLWTNNIYNESFSSSDKDFFGLGTKYGAPLGCRCYSTYRFLRHQGFKENEVLMTGCPAWYDLERINQMSITKHHESVKKICFSEPLREENIGVMLRLLLHLRKCYSNATIKLVIHRDMKESILSLKSILDKHNIEMVDISGSVDGFKVYDDCDFHVGFRVHAHIYNLSIRNMSFLFNEDMRGAGINQTLGLESMNRESSFKHKRLLVPYYVSYNDYDKSDTICKQFDDLMEYSEITDFHNFSNAFCRMKNYFGNMEKHFEIINNIIYN